MKFWNRLRWVGTVIFVGIWLLSGVYTPTDSSTPTQALPHAAPAFHH